MAGVIWSKFFWSDWHSDPALRLCSYAARGLWMDMLCIAAVHDPIGYVSVAGRGLTETDIARMTGGSESEVSALLSELSKNGVFSRDRKGTIYSRRMIRDAKSSAIAKKNGKKGGNPSLGNIKENMFPVIPSDNHDLKPQEPEARSQKPENSEGDKSPSAANAANGTSPAWWPTRDKWGRIVPSDIPDKIVFDVGKVVLGRSAGGLITRAKKAYRGDLRAVTDFLLQAHEKSEPAAWFTKVVRAAELDEPWNAEHIRKPEHSY